MKTINIKFRKFDWLNDMNGFWIKSTFLSILLFSSLFFISTIDNANAEDKVVIAKSIGLDKTAIIEFTNNGTINIQTFRLWLGSDFSFESFKTQDSWTGKKTPQGVLILTTDSSLKPGETVKFGLETDNEKPGINWKALDENDEQIEIGKTLTSDLPHYEKQIPSEISGSEPAIGILDSSTFRIIPETPNVGSTIRVVGEGFAPNYNIDLYLDAEKLDSFQVPDSGNFVATTKIPSNEVAKRVEFFVKDNEGNEKFLSVRLGETKNRMAIIESIPLTIKNLPSVIHPGEVLKVSGSGLPGSSVTATINTPDGEILSSFVASVDTNGNWNNEYLVPLGIVFGEYTAEISDGRETKLVKWTIESAQSIQISPTKILFDPGSAMIFNGTAIPNQELEIILENPQGSEVFSKVISIDNSGIVEFEIPTTFDDIDGTYILYSFQGGNTAITLVGLGEVPKPQLIARTDKLNYQVGDIVNFAIDGPPSATLTLLLLDPSEKTKLSDSIVLGADGKKSFEIDLDGYAAGVYILVLSGSGTQTEEAFSVGLQTGSGPLEIGTTKDEYKPGDPILILGDSGENILVTLTLLDPDGNNIKSKQSFTNKDGKLSEDSFRIPADAKPGTWKLRASSGPNLDIIEFIVGHDIDLEGIVIVLGDVENIPTIGKIIEIKIFGAEQTVDITITSPSGETVGEQLSLVASSGGEIVTPWPIPQDAIAGTYTVSVKDARNNATANFILE